MAQPIVLDTDIGTDVDDAMALLLACASPEIELVGVTTGGGAAHQRARLAVRLLREAGRRDIPVYAGMSTRLLPYKPDHFGPYDGHGLGIDSLVRGDYERQHAVEYLLHLARERGPELTLVTIGPLNNIGAAIAVDPGAMGRFKELVIMGGAFWVDRARRGEYNVSSDPEAIKVVLGLEVPTTFVGLDVTLQVVNGPSHMARLRQANTPLTDLAHAMLADYQARLGRDTNNLHDPLALTCAFERRFVRFVEEAVDIEVEEGEGRGVMSIRAEGPTKQLAREVEGAAFMEFFVDRLVRLGKQLA